MNIRLDKATVKLALSLGLRTIKEYGVFVKNLKKLAKEAKAA